MGADTAGRWLGWLLLAGYAALMAVEAARYFRAAPSLEGALPAPAEPASRRRLWAGVIAALIASRLLAALVCAVCWRVEAGTLSGFPEALWERLFPWDAGHYIDIIENGYVATGDARLFIVFFPLYPLLCRGLVALTGLGATAVALAVSNLALAGCGAAMYRLGESGGGCERGRRAMLLLMFCPVTYFYSVAYSESLFLLVTLLAALCARRQRFVPAVLFGALASGARVLGLAVAIPIFWELLCHEREVRGGLTFRRAALCVAKVLPVSAGFLAYLFLNWRLFGNPTQFMVFQREHWFQSFGSLANTFRYSLANALEYDDRLYQLGVWRPQVLLLVALPLLVLWRRKRERPGDTAYALVYGFVAFAPTWLLSGPRYASACYALWLLLAGIPRRRGAFIALLAGECALLVFMTWVGLWMGKAY